MSWSASGPRGSTSRKATTGHDSKSIVSHVEALGNENLVHGAVAGIDDAALPFVFRAPPRVAPRRDERIGVRVDVAQLLLFDRVSEQRLHLTGPVATADDRRAAG